MRSATAPPFINSKLKAMQETWKFTYTLEPHYKKAVNKNGSIKRGKTKFIITNGAGYSECFRDAKQEGGFNDQQLIGSFKVANQN